MLHKNNNEKRVHLLFVINAVDRVTEGAFELYKAHISILRYLSGAKH